MTAETTPGRVERPASDYAALLARVRRTGLLDRSAVGYLPRLIALGVMTAAGVVAMLWLGRSWWQLFVAAYFAIVFAQIGFLGHDAGHQQIFRRKAWNDLSGLLLSNLGIGLSFGWWVDKHNRHHRHPNDLDRDPDVKRNVLAWSDDQANSQRGPLRVVARHQAAFFFPLLLFEAWNLHVGSVRTLLSHPRGRAVEIALLLAHAGGCLALLVVVMSPVRALVFVAVQQALLGLYLGCSFAPNHKGMPAVDDLDAADFLRRQVLTSRNIAGGRVTAAIFGGLNYQIEHHLFPSMPSRNLRRCQPLVQDFCAARGVAYCEASVIGSYTRALTHLGGIRPVAQRGLAASERG